MKKTIIMTSTRNYTRKKKKKEKGRKIKKMETHNKGRLQMVIFKNKRLKEEEVKAETMER